MRKREELKERAELLAERGICILKDINRYVEELEKLLEGVPNNRELERVARFYKALSDPFRIKMLYVLRTRPLTVCELMVAMNATQPTITHHLNILENAGIICKKKEGRWTYCKLKYEKIFDDVTSVVNFLSAS